MVEEEDEEEDEIEEEDEDEEEEDEGEDEDEMEVDDDWIPSINMYIYILNNLIKDMCVIFFTIGFYFQNEK